MRTAPPLMVAGGVRIAVMGDRLLRGFDNKVSIYMLKLWFSELFRGLLDVPKILGSSSHQRITF